MIEWLMGTVQVPRYNLLLDVLFIFVFGVLLIAPSFCGVSRGMDADDENAQR